jgi:hypothetical protein
MTTMNGTTATPIDVSAMLRALARTEPGEVPVISLYLDTRSRDEHQRERVRVFVKNSVTRAAVAAGRLDDELAWITEQTEALVAGPLHPDAAGVAMFAGGSLPVRVFLPTAVPFADAFLVAERPCLRPFVTALGDGPRAAMLFVDGECARLVALTALGAADEIDLEATDTIGQHRRGGWRLLMQSRYQRHIHEHRRQHFDAVAEALADVAAQYGLRSIVLAGEARNLAVFRKRLRPGLAARIVGDVAGARYEPSRVLAERALALIRNQEAGDAAADLRTALAEAEAGGRSVAGTDATIDAVNRGTVDRLYLLVSYQEPGRACRSCRALQRPSAGDCRWCGGPTSSLELGEAMVQRTLAAGGDVASVDVHGGLDRAGGVAARLRYR